MKQFITPRNIAIAIAVVVAIYLLWPAKKKPGTGGTVIPIPRPGADNGSGSAINADDHPSKETMGPTLQARQVPAPPARETLVRLEERQHTVSKSTL